LTWQDNSNNETSFKIQRKTGSGSWSTIHTTSANTTSYQNTGLSANTTYYYRVYAYNSYGNSGYSNTANATTQSAANPVLSVNPTTLNFGTTTTSKTFNISNAGTGTLTWSAAENPDKSWIISISPNSSSGNATVTVTIN